MCFKNLPIEFDGSGKARLREGLADPWVVKPAARKGYVRRRSGPGAQLAAPPRLREWSIDPMTHPELVTTADKPLSPNGDIHGYPTIKDIMDAMNPLTGKIYLEALEWTRVGRIMCQLMYGKYPHPSTLVPGGVSTTITTSSFNEFYAQMGKIIDFSKVLPKIWDDLLDFFLAANPDYEQVGARKTNIAQSGIWDNSN